MNKAELRKSYLAKRQALSEEEYVNLNISLCENFLQRADFTGVKAIHIFLPIVAKREVNTFLIIKRLQQEYPHIKLLTSITDIERNSLITCKLLLEAVLQTNRWGIPEPVEVMEADPKSIDWILVPLLTFDAQGHRVGYGKGFYDRYFTQCRPDVQKVGLSLFSRLETIDNVEPTDIALNALFTPNAHFKF